MVLVGRERESAQLAELLEQARHGSASSVVVRGEPGVGKSALLDALVSHAVSGAGEVLVLRTQGLEVEAPLAFAALHRLLLPVMRLRDELPVPQARALRVAFGQEDGPSVEPFLVAVATLSLLTAAAEEKTLLCVVEDAHWLDPATADALLFCARRLGADRLLLVFSIRDAAATTWFRPDGIGELVLTGLDANAARALLDQRPGAAPALEVVERLIAETGGNPLALLELPAELSAEQLGGSAPLPTQLHLSTRVEQAFLDRSHQLPAPVQSVLLLAAADDTGDLAVVRGAASTLGVTSRPSRPPWTPGCWSPTREQCRCVTRWCARPSTRPPPESSAAASTARWPTPWPGSGTPTVERGTVPPRLKAPIPRSSQPSRSSGPVPSVAVHTPRPRPPSSARQH